MNWELKSKLSTVLIVFFTALSFGLTAQIAPGAYWIQFTDKDNSPFSISNPNVYLSQRAIDRRSDQGISITEQDFPVNPTYLAALESQPNVYIMGASRWMNGVVLRTLDSTSLSNILMLPFVDSVNSKKVELDGGLPSDKLDPKGVVTENEDEFNPNAEGLNYGMARTQNEMIAIDYIHDLGYTGQDLVIAVMDGGFEGADTSDILKHLWQNNKILDSWDFVINNELTYGFSSNHGTLVMNCMAGYKPGRYIGSAPDAQYILLKTEDVFSEYLIEEYNWVLGAEFADSAGADVFNTSLGYTTFDDSLQNHTYADLDGNTTIITIGADIAASKGILVVNSAGNSGGGSWYYIGAPADGDSVLAIGAVRGDEIVAGFSSRGPSADGRVKPNVMAMGAGVPMPWGDDSTFYINGTSFSGPILAGAAASFWNSRPGYDNMEVYHAIEESAHLFANPNDDYGFGIPNFQFAYFLITGIEDVSSQEMTIPVYPNPTVDKTSIVVGPSVIDRVSILNNLGRVVKVVQSPQVSEGVITLNLEELPVGMYIIEMQTAGTIQSTKVIKN